MRMKLCDCSAAAILRSRRRERTADTDGDERGLLGQPDCGQLREEILAVVSKRHARSTR